MTLYEYKMLSEDEQWDAVFSRGKFAKNGQIEPLKTEFFGPLKKSFQTML